LGFPYAVIKKYSEDRGGQLAALLTYYGFLSLFPLLLVASAILQIVSFSNSHFKQTVINYATQYFPVLGQHLESNIHDLKGTHAVLIISVLVTIWGAKGIADIFQFAINNIWNVPHPKRPGFIKRSLKSLGIILLAGGGFILAAIFSGYAASVGQGLPYSLVPILVSTVILFCVFMGLFKWALASPKDYRDSAIVRSALFVTIGIEILQLVGVALVKHQLGHLSTYYGTFGATLALLFWIYLQAQIVIYGAEIGSVYDKRKWPRNL
jgi:YihY family inner membrane protein